MKPWTDDIVFRAIVTATLIIVCAFFITSSKPERNLTSAPYGPYSQNKTNSSVTDKSFVGIGPEGWTAIFTLGLVVFTGVLSWTSIVQIKFLRRAEAVTQKQLSDTAEALLIANINAEVAKKSADAAVASVEIQRVAMIVANRAWLRPEIIIAGNLIINETRVRISYNIEVKNSGTSPAIFTQYHHIELVAKTARSFDDPRGDVETIYNGLKSERLDRGVMIQTGHIDQNGQIYQRDIIRGKLEAHRMTEGLFVRLYLIGSIPYTFISDKENCHQSCFVYEILHNEQSIPFFDCDVEANYPREGIILREALFMDSWTAD